MADPSSRDEVQLHRPPGRRTFLQMRASAWLAVGIGSVAVVLAAAALWVALHPRDNSPTVATMETKPAGEAYVVMDTPPPPVPPPVVEPLDAGPSPIVLLPPAVQPVPVMDANKPSHANTTAPPPDTTALPAASVAASAPQVTTDTTPVAGGCAALQMYDAAYSRMTVAELEQRASKIKYMAPSMTAQQLESLKTTAENYAPAMRECMYKSTLVQLIAQRAHRRTKFAHAMGPYQGCARAGASFHGATLAL